MRSFGSAGLLLSRLRARTSLRQLTLLAALGLSSVVTACSDRGPQAGSDVGSEVRQTHFPGQVTAGGGTSGQVMAQASKAPKAPKAAATAPQQGGTPHIPQGSGGNTGGATDTRPAAGGGAPGEAERGQAPGQGVAGTPGIPEGSGGTPSGAEMGGTSSGAAGTKNAPPPQQDGATAPARMEGK